jgi:hypothetical protein
MRLVIRTCVFLDASRSSRILFPKNFRGEKGRPVNPGKRTKIAGTVNAELERLFQEWRESRGITLSRALDAALWHFLGKPKLSFETSYRNAQTNE